MLRRKFLQLLGLGGAAVATAPVAALATSAPTPDLSNYDLVDQGTIRGYFLDGQFIRVHQMVIRTESPEGLAIRVSVDYISAPVALDIYTLKPGLEGAPCVCVARNRSDHARLP